VIAGNLPFIRLTRTLHYIKHPDRGLTDNSASYSARLVRLQHRGVLLGWAWLADCGIFRSNAIPPHRLKQ